MTCFIHDFQIKVVVAFFTFLVQTYMIYHELLPLLLKCWSIQNTGHNAKCVNSYKGIKT